jgi:phage shock protein A
MTTLDQSHSSDSGADETEVVKGLEQRGVQGLDSLSLEELELLTERKRKQLHQEAIDKKAQLESEIASVSQQIQELQATKTELETQLRALAKSMGSAGKNGDGATRRAPRKPKKSTEADAGADNPSIPVE